MGEVADGGSAACPTAMLPHTAAKNATTALLFIAASPQPAHAVSASAADETSQTKSAVLPGTLSFVPARVEKSLLWEVERRKAAASFRNYLRGTSRRGSVAGRNDGLGPSPRRIALPECSRRAGGPHGC